MKFGRGTAWMLRWFAKPVVTGSIPAPASIPRVWTSDPFDFFGGKEPARALLKSAAFNKSYEPPTDDILLIRALFWKLSDDAKNYKERLIEANRKLSALKRH